MSLHSLFRFAGLPPLGKVCKVCRAAIPDDPSHRFRGLLCSRLLPDWRSIAMTETVHGEHKKRRHVLLTDTAFSHLGNIAHEARLSNSETLERLIRSTPVWEGSSTLADNAWEECMDHTQELVSPDSLFPDEGL